MRAVLVAYEHYFAGRHINARGAWNRLIFGRHGLDLFCSAESDVTFLHQAAQKLYSTLWQFFFLREDINGCTP